MQEYRLSGVTLRHTAFKGRDAIELTMPASANQDPTKEALIDRNYMAWLPADFHDGTISVDVASTLSVDAPSYARGSIGVTFRVGDDDRFESIYLRPLNSRVGDQIRRNRSIQYVAYPDFTFPRLRAEEPGKYETYADLPMDEWINLRVVVESQSARLFLDNRHQPAFVVNDLKLGSSRSGGVGLWIEAGTVGYFSGLNIARAR